MKAWLVRAWIGLAIAGLLTLVGGAAAQNMIENLVQPDLLAEPHKKLEADCSTCHKAFKKAAQSSLCADCHKPVKLDIDRSQGFHGKHPAARKSECFNCHAEHKGRAFKQARFSAVTFAHRWTDYPLDGKHALTACEGCHQPGRKFAEVPLTCFECHKEDDLHQGNLGADCKSCHNTSDWRKITPFDHAQTKFPLRDAHAKAACYACHAGEVYKGLSTACFDCHAMQDVHKARFGAACDTCHNEKNWRHTRFDHGKFTRFPLRGAHTQAACKDCHGAQLASKLPTACFDCHQKQDMHKGQLGKACATCHQETAWRRDVTFDHDLTAFPLLGQHAAVACESCHVTAAFKDAKFDCFSCHKKSDIHEGRFASKCGTCHTASGWRPVLFDHGRDTKFKLTGVHAKVGCNGCHTATNATSAKVPTNCFACHKAQDIHRGEFGRDCGRCHTTVSFRRAVIRK